MKKVTKYHLNSNKSLTLKDGQVIKPHTDFECEESAIPTAFLDLVTVVKLPSIKNNTSKPKETAQKSQELEPYTTKEGSNEGGENEEDKGSETKQYKAVLFAGGLYKILDQDGNVYDDESRTKGAARKKVKELNEGNE